MANKIYTKTGDKGRTALFGGSRVSKDDLRIEAYGTVDELNSFLGFLSDHLEEGETKTYLISIQSLLFNIGSILATDPEKPELKMQFEASYAQSLEEKIDEMQKELAPLKNFILPGGHKIVSLCHILRTVSRRAERRIVSLAKLSDIDQSILIYLNRLSDFFFVLGRWMAKELEIQEVKWNA